MMILTTLPVGVVLLLLASVLVGCAKARVEPELSIGLTTKNIGSKDGAITEVTGVFEPNVKFTTTGTFGGFDYEVQ